MRRRTRLSTEPRGTGEGLQISAGGGKIRPPGFFRSYPGRFTTSARPPHIRSMRYLPSSPIGNGCSTARRQRSSLPRVVSKSFCGPRRHGGGGSLGILVVRPNLVGRFGRHLLFAVLYYYGRSAISQSFGTEHRSAPIGSLNRPRTVCGWRFS